MIITIDTTKDTLDVKDIYHDSDLNLLAEIQNVRYNRNSGDSQLLKKVVQYVKNLSPESPFSHIEGTNTIQQIKMVRFAFRLAGAKVKDITNKGFPADVESMRTSKRFSKLFPFLIKNTKLQVKDDAIAFNLAFVNDNGNTTDKEREKEIKQIFRENGVTVKFVN